MVAAVAMAAVVVVAIHLIIAIIIIAIIIILPLLALEPFLHLRLSAGDDTVIVLGMLQIIFCHNPVAGALRIARELSVFLGYVLGSTSDFNIRTRTVIASGQGIRPLAVVVIIVVTVVIVVVIIVIVTPAAALVLLSWPHQFVT